MLCESDNLSSTTKSCWNALLTSSEVGPFAFPLDFKDTGHLHTLKAVLMHCYPSLRFLYHMNKAKSLSSHAQALKGNQIKTIEEKRVNHASSH